MGPAYLIGHIMREKRIEVNFLTGKVKGSTLFGGEEERS